MPNVAELPPATYTAPDRDPVITIDGCRIYLHIHDAEYMRQRADWLRRIAAAHPDHGGSNQAVRKLLAARDAWRLSEALWYASLGLLPPDNYQPPARDLSRPLRTVDASHDPRIVRERALAARERASNPKPHTSDRRTHQAARRSNRPVTKPAK